MTPNIRMLSQELPREEVHSYILDQIIRGELGPEETAEYFYMPGVGFHRSLYTLTLHQAEYVMAGRQNFVIPPAMQTALANTSLEDVSPSEVRTPYPNQYIALPEGQTKIWGGNKTQWHQVEGVYVRFRRGVKRHYAGADTEPKTAPPNDPGCVYLYLWGPENERSTHVGDDASMWMVLDLHEMEEEGYDLETYLKVILEDPRRDTTLEDMENPEVMKGLGLVTQLPEGQEARKNIIDTLRIVFGTFLYMDSTDPVLELDPATEEKAVKIKTLEDSLSRTKDPTRGKGKKLQRKLEKIPKDVTTWVGGRSWGTLTIEEPKDRNSPRKHWVRGHWWPKKATIKNKFNRKEQEIKSLILEAGSASDTRKEYLQWKVVKFKEELLELKDKLDSKRRWVMPYIRGTKNLENSRTYIVK